MNRGTISIEPCAPPALGVSGPWWHWKIVSISGEPAEGWTSGPEATAAMVARNSLDRLNDIARDPAKVRRTIMGNIPK